MLLSLKDSLCLSLPENRSPMLHVVEKKGIKYDTLESAKDVLELLEVRAQDVTELDLSGNTYSPEVFREIARIIKKMKSLDTLRGESFLDTLTSVEAKEVIACLADALPSTLSSLEIVSNALSAEFPTSLEKFIEETPLKVLVLHDCGLGEFGAKRVVDALARRQNKGGLVLLNISKNRIVRLPENFGSVLSSFPDLQEFRMRHNSVDEKSLAKFLADFTGKSLKVLDLSDNFISGGCISPLCDLIRRSAITGLFLHDGKLEEGEIDEVIKALSSMPSQQLPGSLCTDKPRFTLDVSCIYWNQDTVPLLEKLAKKLSFDRLILFENDYTDIEDLKEIVEESGGVVVDDEDDLNASKALADDTELIMKKIEQLGASDLPL